MNIKRLLPCHDTLFNLLLSIAVLIAMLAAAFSCVSCASLPKPDLSKVPRQQISRVVHDSAGIECRAYLPLVAQVELMDEEELGALLSAAQPWAEALKFAAVVPVQPELESPTLYVGFDACPAKWQTTESEFGCSRLAEVTERYCEGGVYKQKVAIYVNATTAQLVYILMHEIGHALGADEALTCAPANLKAKQAWGHSCDEDSIMFHAIRLPEDQDLMGGPAGADVSFPRKFPKPPSHVTSEDIENVRMAWGLLPGLARK